MAGRWPEKGTEFFSFWLLLRLAGRPRRLAGEGEKGTEFFSFAEEKGEEKGTEFFSPSRHVLSFEQKRKGVAGEGWPEKGTEFFREEKVREKGRRGRSSFRSVLFALALWMRIVWDTEEDAREFFDSYRRALKQRHSLEDDALGAVNAQSVAIALPGREIRVTLAARQVEVIDRDLDGSLEGR